MTKGPWTSGSDAIGAALTLAVSVALFGYLGHRLDLALDSSPLCLLIATALGAFGGFLHVLRVLAPDVHLFGTPSKPSTPRESSADESSVVDSPGPGDTAATPPGDTSASAGEEGQR